MGFGSWIVISFSQHSRLPSPAFVQSASVPQVAQRYLFPSLLIELHSLLRPEAYFFSSTGFPQHLILPSPPRVTMNSAPQPVHM